MGENESFMVQPKEEIKVFPEVCSRYFQEEGEPPHELEDAELVGEREEHFTLASMPKM